MRHDPILADLGRHLRQIDADEMAERRRAALLESARQDICADIGRLEQAVLTYADEHPARWQEALRAGARGASTARWPLLVMEAVAAAAVKDVDEAMRQREIV